MTPVVVDTSVWVAALRRRSSSESEALDGLLDRDLVLMPIPVRIELLSGASAEDAARLDGWFSALPSLEPDGDVWRLMLEWTRKSRESGERFGLGDLLIGAQARRADAPVWSLDRDFERMAALGFVRLFPASQR